MHDLAPYLANPMHWVPAYEQVKNIKPGNIISIAVLDFYLNCESHRSRSSLSSAQWFYYIDQNTAGKLKGDSKEDHKLLRNFFAIATEKILLAPFLILITTGHNTYFLAMFDFLQDKALILGRCGLPGSDFNKAYAEWRSWNGHTLWQKIHNALIIDKSKEMEVEPISYETDLIPVTNISVFLYKILTYLTFQRNSHSGPGILGFVQLLKENKWNWDEFLSSTPMPEVPCDHSSQERVFHVVLQDSYESFTMWKSVPRSNNDWTQPPEPLLDEMYCHPTRLQWVRNLSLIFHNQSSKCKRCSLRPGFDNFPPEDATAPRGQKVRVISPFTPLKQKFPLPDPLPLGNNAEQLHISPAKEDANNSIFQSSFDDYCSAPLFRKEPPPVLNTWTFNSSGFLVLPSWASTWKDQGYRLPPDFNKVSPQEYPTDYLSRLLPIVDKNDPLSPCMDVSESTSEVKDDKRRKPISMGAYAMLDEAGKTPKTKESYNTFVRGKTRADDFIKLDLERDHIPLTREQITISVDIDSILWVTRGGEFSSKGAINLHLKHHFTDHLPFSANPSVYITLFKPPYDEDELIHPQYRQKVQFPLSHIPHMTFGHFGEATQQFNLYVFFPRMVHKNENNNRAITIMPHELQELWLSEAVFKALAASMDDYPGTSEYIPHSTEQLRWKSGGHTSRQPTFPVSPPAIKSLLANIRSEVVRNEDLLSRFGSFFFVLDARGIKTLTKQHNSDMNAFQILQTVVPSLDWDHMVDRKNGELYLDLGISFHPINTLEPMVGLWRLSSLRPSYALMGYSKRNSKEYSHNTMQDYGGIKAETSNSTKDHTHIVKRISYNLHFEAVRKPGERDYVSKLDDMIRCNQKYVDSCKCWIQLLEAAESHSYGVRDELRAGAHVVTHLLPVVIEKVRL